MKRIFVVLSAFSAIALCGCSDEAEDIGGLSEAGMSTRAASANVVWEAQPGDIDVPLGQSVTINLDGSVIKN